jgi:hypothetical protein
MTVMARLAKPIAVAGALVVTIIFSGAGIAAASGSGTGPFTDPKQQGLITLCNSAGQPMTSGSLTANPFVAQAISSDPAPTAYAKGGLATLFAYQPIQNVPPGDWSGQQLNAGGYFNDPSHPASVFTVADRTLLSFSQEFAPHWDGLYQLRLIYTAPDLPEYFTSYPTAVLRVSGSSWTMVQGGNTRCSAGGGTSFAQAVLGKKGVREVARRNGVKVGSSITQTAATQAAVRPSTSATAASGSKSPASATSGGSSTSATTADGVGSSGSGSGSGSGPHATPATDSGGMSSAAKALIGLVVAVAIATVGTVVAMRRRGREAPGA